MDEENRILALNKLAIWDSNSTKDLDAITTIIAAYFEVPFSYISLINADSQKFKSSFGFHSPAQPRGHAFCSYTVRGRDVFVVEDTLLDERFWDNPAVTSNPHIRFYAGAPLLTHEGLAIGALCVMDVKPRKMLDEQRARLQEMAELAMTHVSLRRSVGRVNSISGIPNKFQLADDLDALKRSGDRVRRVMVHIDIPDAETGFEIASTFGIEVYDDLVRGISRKIKEVFGAIADIYHLANNQFALISQNLSAEQFIAILKESEEVLLQPVQSMNVPLNLHSYGGYVEFHAYEGTATEVSRKALSAAHSAFIQQQRWSAYDLAEDIRSRRAFRLLNDLPRAIDARQLYLVYQPKFDVKSRSVTSAEALIRWRHPDLGDIPPSEFIPLVEKTALVRNLSEWVFCSALRQQKEWMRTGIFIRMSVNLSGRNFMEPDLLNRLKRECERQEISPEWIEIECTEGVWMNGSAVATNLVGIRDLGFTIALDDFGSGYSNFSYLQQIPASVLKFDRSLIQNIETSERDNRVVRSLAAFAQTLGYKIVVEGVESEKAFVELSALGVDEIQGYFFSRPLNPEMFKNFLKTINVNVDPMDSVLPRKVN